MATASSSSQAPRESSRPPRTTAVAARLLDRPLPAGYLEETTALVAQPKRLENRRTESAVIFRLGDEWLAFATTVVSEIAPARAIHSLPHRRAGAVLGVTNIRGEVFVCVSLALLLGARPRAQEPDQAGRRFQRLLVARHGDTRVVFPVDEVHGVHRFAAEETTDVPATVARAIASHTRAMLRWDERSVGWLDAERVFHAVNRTLA